MSQLVHNNIHSCQKQIIVFLLLLDNNTVFHEYKGLNVKTLGIYALRWNKLFPVSVVTQLGAIATSFILV